jgi:hypothetical protein
MLVMVVVLAMLLPSHPLLDLLHLVPEEAKNNTEACEEGEED